MNELISITGLNKSYGKKHVVSDVSLSIHKGQIVGLVGPNGAGKTTCLQSMLGLIDFEGDINVLGHHPRKDREKMLNDVAYISDVAILPKWLKVTQALSYMNDVHPNFDIEKARTFLAKTNIDMNDKVKALSKGMVTQLHLSLVLAIDAKVLVLDEPTLGLDILTRRQFYTHLLEDFYTEDKCILITTHQIEEIEHILTDVAFIQEGKIVIAESTENIRERFTLLTVTQDNIEQAKQFKPLFSNSLMGLTTMLFDNQKNEDLQALGKISVPSLADIFVGVMTKEICS
ncbi:MULTISPECIES: ABC transporter ATP-binding protein [unclassified Colwellia]|jgi:ABC-2 type transport system ATP-binding protein|uniref:ABC transporter ATP-binding protein n=1 Tax=unclassified Colwellia TaxID=196834 RepID=UPI0015F562FB|nr:MULTISPECIES: ABC transporter ATP-binding protein [unclassified Colwellia]MBA6348905.1 ABC transporter ATP-binding protein [Colwellia sp. BRX8-9]MBA6352215.1 ABC transporter ATP-binding protein [Colwellia sp. BRX9-1]MBA6358045.1 ABC transporter ATP-binding protein [Colwellia sp. BRX8-3]MBA6361823.1 ABC transporter ATP-binding protein [Colwellia sp. BRX8-6]MBA6367820.1 ABC transporter ATP-binding protein [Colwellia sp. BRX8-5]